jgi:hypothetical protein
MGEAIARFRETALAMRQAADAAFIAPEHLFAGMIYALRHLKLRLLDGKVSAADYATILRDLAGDAELSIAGGPAKRELISRNRADANRMFAHYRQPILAKAPAKANLDRQHAAALREADAWGSLLPSIEKHLDALSETTLAMREMAADAWLSRYSQTKKRYAKTLLQWQRAYDALGRFIELPLAASSTTSTAKTKPAKRKKRNRREKGPGGKPETYSLEFIREVFDAYERARKRVTASGKRMPKKATWLFDYCKSRKYNHDEKFPKEDKDGEHLHWDQRANRFWKAGAKRLKEPDGN